MLPFYSLVFWRNQHETVQSRHCRGNRYGWSNVLQHYLENHPWFTVAAVAWQAHALPEERYEDAVGKPLVLWITPMPAAMKDIDCIRTQLLTLTKSPQQVDFVFCAVDMKKDEIRALGRSIRKSANAPLISNNSAHRGTPDVPMISS